MENEYHSHHRHHRSQRMLALDVLRGITIAGMILVNNPGSWSKIYAPLRHAEWNGLTPTDLVFPFFMFIMGISTYFSLRKYDFEWSKSTVLKIARRTAVIFAIGLAIAWFSLFCRTWHALSEDGLPFLTRLGQAAWNFDRIRILGVMQRLALSYGCTAVIALIMQHKNIPYLIATLLITYFGILLLGDGFAYGDTNILSKIDISILGLQHIYNDNFIEPEGLLSTIPAVAHVLIGFCCGRLLMKLDNLNDRMLQLFIVGASLTFAGFLLSYGCPINKKIWSPTFVLTTCGLASTLLALLIWIIDLKRKRQWSRFFEAFGINPLFMYVLAAFFSIILSNIRFEYNGDTISLHGYIYKILLQPLWGDYFGSLVFALLFVAIIWSAGYMLYKKKIYIKI